MQLIMRHQATRTWNEGSRKSYREKVGASSRETRCSLGVSKSSDGHV